jgi:hypothetical protein
VRERTTRLEVLAALRAEGVGSGADLAAIGAAARRLGFELSVAASDGVDIRGQRSVLRRATVGRDGSPVAVAYSADSARAAAFEALGRALIYECRQAGRQAGQTEGAGDAEDSSPTD